MSELQMLTPEEAATELGVSVTKFRKVLDTPDGPRTILWGNERRVPRWHLRQWQEQLVNRVPNSISNLLSVCSPVNPKS